MSERARYLRLRCNQLKIISIVHTYVLIEIEKLFCTAKERTIEALLEFPNPGKRQHMVAASTEIIYLIAISFLVLVGYHCNPFILSCAVSVQKTTTHVAFAKTTPASTGPAGLATVLAILLRSPGLGRQSLPWHLRGLGRTRSRRCHRLPTRNLVPPWQLH